MTEISRRTARGLAVAGIAVALIWRLGAGVTAHAQSTPDSRVITEQNLFSPSRAVPAPPKIERSAAKPVPPPPKPQPRFELSGVVMDEKVTLALLAEPQWTQGKVQILGPGEMVGPYRVVSIAPDHAMLAESGEPAFRVPLSGSKRPTAPFPAAAAAPVRIGPGPAGTVPPTVPTVGNTLLQRRLRQAQPIPDDEGSGAGGAPPGNVAGNAGGNRAQGDTQQGSPPPPADMSPPVSDTGQPIYRPASEGPSTPGPRPPAFNPEDFKRQIQQHLGGAK